MLSSQLSFILRYLMVLFSPAQKQGTRGPCLFHWSSCMAISHHSPLPPVSSTLNWRHWWGSGIFTALPKGWQVYLLIPLPRGAGWKKEKRWALVSGRILLPPLLPAAHLKTIVSGKGSHLQLYHSLCNSKITLSTLAAWRFFSSPWGWTWKQTRGWEVLLSLTSGDAHWLPPEIGLSFPCSSFEPNKIQNYSRWLSWCQLSASQMLFLKIYALILFYS